MASAAPDLVVIGGVVADCTPSGLVPGGAAFYAARTALALGYRVGVLTHDRSDLDLAAVLAGADVATFGNSTITFTNTYGPQGRLQYVEGTAPVLQPAACPSEWQRAAAVLLAPVYHEVEGAIGDCFVGSLLGIAPQGWMRHADSNGRVTLMEWFPTPPLLERATLVSLSDEDLRCDTATERDLSQRCRLLAVTRGAYGCTLYVGGKREDISGFPVKEVDPTGAGDIFAVAMLLRLVHNDNPTKAASFANAAASFAVASPGVSGLASRQQVLARLAQPSRGDQP